jgi:hypothetical protein
MKTKISTGSLIYFVAVTVLVCKSIVAAWHRPTIFEQNSRKLPSLQEFNSGLKSTFRPITDSDASEMRQLIYGRR